MMIYVLILGLIFLLIGVWQIFMKGTWSLITSLVFTILGLLLVFIFSWKIGIALILVFILLQQFGKVIGSDRRKIKRIIQAYKEGKRMNSKLSEDEICRGIIANRIYKTRHSNPLKPRSFKEAQDYVEQIFGDEDLTIEETCVWLVFKENRGGWNGEKALVEETARKMSGQDNEKDKLYEMTEEVKEEIL